MDLRWIAYPTTSNGRTFSVEDLPLIQTLTKDCAGLPAPNWPTRSASCWTGGGPPVLRPLRPAARPDPALLGLNLCGLEDRCAGALDRLDRTNARTGQALKLLYVYPLSRMWRMLWASVPRLRRWPTLSLALLTVAMLQLWRGFRSGDGALTLAALSRALPLEEGEKVRSKRLARLLLALTVAYTLAVLLGAGATERRVRPDCESSRAARARAPPLHSRGGVGRFRLSPSIVSPSRAALPRFGLPTRPDQSHPA